MLDKENKRWALVRFIADDIYFRIIKNAREIPYIEYGWIKMWTVLSLSLYSKY